MQTQAIHADHPARRHSLDELMRYDYDELAALYRAAPAPQSVDIADGRLDGRMLAWRGWRSLVRRKATDQINDRTPEPYTIDQAPGQSTAGTPAARPGAWRFGSLRALARSPRFVWQGKSLSAKDGGGYNRVNLGAVLGRQHILPFATRIVPSLFDRKPTIDIDYDRPDNPWWMRHIHDELRELEPGLFLGLDLWRNQNRSIGLVWFALSALGTVSL